MGVLSATIWGLVCILVMLLLWRVILPGSIEYRDHVLD